MYAWLDEAPAPGHPNAGVVLDPDGATVIDTLCVPSQHKAFAEAVEALGFPVRRIVLTGDHIEYVGGTVSFPMAAVYGSPATSAHLDQPPNPAVYRNLYPDVAAEFDDELQTRRVSHVVDDAGAAHPGDHRHPGRRPGRRRTWWCSWPRPASRSAGPWRRSG